MLASESLLPGNPFCSTGWSFSGAVAAGNRRTHQIRVHMTSIGHPLIGDTLYNPETALLARQALHSYRLAFTHPVTGVPLGLLHPSLQIWQNCSPEYHA